MSKPEFSVGDSVYRLIHVQDPFWCWRVLPSVIAPEPETEGEAEPHNQGRHYHFDSGHGEFKSTNSAPQHDGFMRFKITPYLGFAFERDVFATEAEALAAAAARMTRGEY